MNVCKCLKKNTDQNKKYLKNGNNVLRCIKVRTGRMSKKNIDFFLPKSVRSKLYAPFYNRIKRFSTNPRILIEIL